MANQPVTVQAAGRTDTGVHATGQIVNFTTSAQRPERAWRLGTNSHLPDGVSVVWARSVPADFHARFSALARRYLYLFVSEPASALGAGQWWSSPELDTNLMHTAAQALLGEQDFTAVRAAGCQSPTPWRCVHRVSIDRYGDLVVMDIEANAFLLHMVRNIASMLQQVGTGNQPVEWVSALLADRDRSRLGPTAPAHALYLAQVRYAPELDFPPAHLPPPLRALAGFGALS